jgi:hypothetical protein
MVRRARPVSKHKQSRTSPQNKKSHIVAFEAREIDARNRYKSYSRQGKLLDLRGARDQTDGDDDEVKAIPAVLYVNR